jgi:hypothetical protein
MCRVDPSRKTNLRRNRYVVNIMYCVRLDVYGLHYPLNNFYVM